MADKRLGDGTDRTIYRTEAVKEVRKMLIARKVDDSVIKKLDADGGIKTGEFREEVEYLLGCPKKRKFDGFGMCWDRCPDDHGGTDFQGYKDIGLLCHPKGGPKIVLDYGKRINLAGKHGGRCGPSKYQSQKCIDVANQTEEGTKATVSRLRQLNKNELANDLNTNGFTASNKEDINKALDCPEMRRYTAGLCWDKCPRSNLIPQNKDKLKKVKKEKEELQTKYNEVQKPFRRWHHLMLNYGKFVLDNGTPKSRMTESEVRDKLLYEDLQSQLLRVDEYKAREKVVIETRLKFEEKEKEYVNELDTFKRNFVLGYNDIGMLCEPRSVLGRSPSAFHSSGHPVEFSESDKKIALENANLAGLTPAERSGGPGVKVSLTRRQYCDPTVNPPQRKIAGVCWDRCPPGYRDDGATCSDRRTEGKGAMDRLLGE